MSAIGDYSVEMAATRIHDSRTRHYFSEVHSAYMIKAYRSATVTLWSVVVADLLFKLDTLAHTHGDAAAVSILNDIEQKRERSPHSSDWEWELVIQIDKRTAFFSPSALVELTSLHKHRHLCAHPVITNDDALFTPSPEITRAHMRAALEGILTSPPRMTRRVFDPLVEDLARIRDIFPEDDTLRQYLSAKYFHSLTGTPLSHVFRRLWQVCFVCEDERAMFNRAINIRALQLLFAQNTPSILESMRAEPSRFAHLGTSYECHEGLFSFLRSHPTAFTALSSAFQLEVEHLSKSTAEWRIIAWYLAKTTEQHITELEGLMAADSRWIPPVLFGRLVDLVEGTDQLPRVLKLGIKRYSASIQYAEADGAFRSCVVPYLKRYSRSLIETLIAASGENCQTFGRNRAKMDHGLVLERWRELDDGQPPSSDESGFWRDVDMSIDEDSEEDPPF